MLSLVSRNSKLAVVLRIKFELLPVTPKSLQHLMPASPPQPHLKVMSCRANKAQAILVFSSLILSIEKLSAACNVRQFALMMALRLQSQLQDDLWPC
jgi:hypothetical protein